MNSLANRISKPKLPEEKYRLIDGIRKKHMLTVSRPSKKYAVTDEGVLVEYADHELAWEYRDGTWSALIEGEAVNLMVISEQLGLPEITTSNVDVFTNKLIAPNGKANGCIVSPNTTSTTHAIGDAISFVNGSTYVQSVFLKYIDHRYIKLRGGNDTTWQPSAIFDLQNGVVHSQDGDVVNIGIEPFSNGWYRCWITGLAGASAGTNAEARFIDTDGSTEVFVGSGTQVGVWGFDTQLGDFLTSYIPGKPTFVSRASTKTYVDSAGILQTASVDEEVTDNYVYINGEWVNAGQLLEDRATNFITYSEDLSGVSWSTVNCNVNNNYASVSLLGSTCNRITATTTTGGHNITDQITVTNGVTYTQSVVVKSDGENFVRLVFSSAQFGSKALVLDLTDPGNPLLDTVDKKYIRHIGNGWYYISVTATATATGLAQFGVGLGAVFSYAGNATDSMLVAYLQVEAGDFATSYIPTAGATVTREADVYSTSTTTRAADDPTISGTAFSDFYNVAEGTFVAKWRVSTIADTANRIFEVSDGTTGNRYLHATNNPLEVTRWYISVSSVQADILTSALAVDTWYKTVCSYKLNDIAMHADGLLVGTDNAASVSALINQMAVGFSPTSGNAFYLDGHIEELTYYPKRIINARQLKVSE